MNSRDDFTAPVKRQLAARVAHKCSNPRCRASTSGPQLDEAGSVNLGVAAHITAASPNGPRFDSSLIPEERCGAENGIWLCQNCAKLIDSDVKRFTARVLLDWKEQAESAARAEMGRTSEAGSPSPQSDRASVFRDNEVGRSATNSLAGWMRSGHPGADAQGPGDASTTDESPTQLVHGQTTSRPQSGSGCSCGGHLGAQRPPD